MILIMGPAGAGKSMQGKMLVKTDNYHWISAGQLLRDHINQLDEEARAMLQHGELLPGEVVQDLVAKAILEVANPEMIILDGFPREISEGRWLLDFCSKNNISIKHVIHLEVSLEVARERLLSRGRTDDNEEAINMRLKEYQQKTLPTIAMFKQEGVPVDLADGEQGIDKVHAQILKVVSDVH